MANHPPKARTELEEELDPHVGGEDQTFDDRLASDLYKDYSSQNQVFIQIFLALSGRGFKYGVDVRDAYAFFAKEKIDPEKLIKDPVYRAQIKKHAGHVNFWEKGAVEKGTSKLGAVLDGANRAIKEVDDTCEKLVTLKEGLIKDYSTELQNLYGLDKKEIDAIMQRAKYAVRADPNISMQDYVQREAQEMARNNIKKEVENEAKAKNEKLTPIKKETAISVKTAQKKSDYDVRAQSSGNIEKANQDRLTNDCKRQLNQILTATPPTSIPPPPPPPPPQPAAVTPPPVAPPIILTPPMISAIPIPGGYSLRNVPIPTFGGFKTGLNILGNGFGKLFGGMGSFIGRRGLGRAMNLAGNLGKRAINRALDAFMPGLGMTVSKINDVIKSITGIDIEKTILMGAAILVGAVAAIVIVLPIIIGIGVFSSITGDKPMVITSTNYRDLGWIEFNNQYLTTQSNALTLDSSANPQNDKTITWQQFEKDYINFQKKYLSLEKIN